MPTMHYMPDLEAGQLLKFSIEPTVAGLKTVAAPRLVPNGKTAVRAVPATLTSAALEAAQDSGGYTTNGWDTVYAVTLPDVNAAIVKQKSSPTSWEAHIPADGFSAKLDATGTFKDWQLTIGGSGSIIRMHVPFTADVTVGGSTHFDVQGGVAFVEVKLEYIPQPPKDGSTPNDLKVRASGGSNDDPVVTVTSVTYTSPAPPVDGLAGALVNLLDQWMNANLEEFQHVFATVDIATEEAKGDFAWLAPTWTSYAYLDNEDINFALLGILSMTEDRSHEGAVQSIGANAIPDGSRASFNLSLERVMSKMIMPALPLEFTHAPAGTFTLSADATQIEAGQNYDLDQVKVGAIWYTPTVTHFSIAFVNGQLQTSIQVHTPISPGIDAYFSGTYYTTMTLGTKADGTQSLTWDQAADPVTNNWYTVADWITITEAIVSLIVAVAGAVVGGVVTNVTNVVIKVLIAILVGGVVGAIVYVLSQIPNWIAGAVPDQAPSVSGLTDGATKPQQWADSQEFKITTAQLNGGMQLGGNPFGTGS